MAQDVSCQSIGLDILTFFRQGIDVCDVAITGFCGFVLSSKGERCLGVRVDLHVIREPTIAVASAL
jgi:hypothetical protein